MKDTRTRDQILKALNASEANLAAANKETKNLMTERADLLNRIEGLKKDYREIEARERKLLSEKSAVYGEDWQQSRTREWEYIEKWRVADRRASILRGALVALAGKPKADEIEAEAFPGTS